MSRTAERHLVPKTVYNFLAWTTYQSVETRPSVEFMNTILVTGGAGFIGSCFVRQWIAEETTPLVNLDKLTYAGNLDSLLPVASHPNYRLVEGDIGDRKLVGDLLAEHRPRAIVNFAAESHVDRSIDG